MSSSLDHELHATSRGALNGGAFHATVGCEMIVPRPILQGLELIRPVLFCACLLPTDISPLGITSQFQENHTINRPVPLRPHSFREPGNTGP